MNTQELKDVLAQRILNIDDDSVLNSIKLLTDKSIKEYELNSLERSMVMEAQADYSSGKVVSHEEVNDELDSWLAEK